MLLKPFRLQSEYRDYVWGGKRLRPHVGTTAEVWMVYEENVIAEGKLQGKTLGQATKELGVELVGTRAVMQTGDRFPLLIKILDCAAWLSLQVHPNDEQAEKWEGSGEFGKTEAWYVVDADPGAQLVSGFLPGILPSRIKESVGKKELMDIVRMVTMRKGDAILVTPGTIHALGPGLMVYEVQQTSDITYRVYDWDRPMKAGRKLHLEQAADVLKADTGNPVIRAEQVENGSKPFITSEYFSLELLTHPIEQIWKNTNGESFHSLTMIDGKGSVAGDGWNVTLEKYENLLVPACVGRYQVATHGSKCLLAFVL